MPDATVIDPSYFGLIGLPPLYSRLRLSASNISPAPRGYSIFKVVDKVSPQLDLSVLPASGAQATENASLLHRSSWVGLSQTLAQELWLDAEAEGCGLKLEEFVEVLAATGERFNFGLPQGTSVSSTKKASFLRSLGLADLALTKACSLGREVAWERFLRLYRAPLTQAAIAITHSATTGCDLADALYDELYGPCIHTSYRSVDSVPTAFTGEAERSGSLPTQHGPLISSFSGRASLLGWLRTLLAERYVERYDVARSEAATLTPDFSPAVALSPSGLAARPQAIAHALEALSAEEQFVLSAYLLDRAAVRQIAQTLHAGEDAMNHRIEQLIAGLREQMLYNLQTEGLSKRAAEEVVGIDPLDFEINLHSLLRSSAGKTPPASSSAAVNGTAAEAKYAAIPEGSVPL